MQPFPHHYVVTARADDASDVALDSNGLPTLPSASPVQFGGAGTRWSPESLLVASVVACFVLTFRAIATVSKLSWVSLSCDANGTLDRIDRVTQFTAFDLRATLRLPAGADAEQAERLLKRAEETCLVSNSLKARPRLTATIEVAL